MRPKTWWALPLVMMVVVPAAAQKPAPSPFVEALDAVAQQQLKARASAVAAIRDIPSAQARKAAVRQRVLSLIGGLPDYRGPLNPRVTKTTARDGYAIDNVMFESLPGY